MTEPPKPGEVSPSTEMSQPAKSGWSRLGLFVRTAVPLLVIYLVTAGYAPAAQTNDTRAVAVAATTLAETGSLTMDAFAGEDLWLFWNGERWLTNRFPGAIFLTTPFALATRAAPGTVAIGALAAAVIAAAAMGTLALGLRRIASPAESMVAAWVIGLATSTWAISAGSMWTHGPAQLWLAMAVITIGNRHLTAGSAFGLALFTRPHLGVISAVTGLRIFASNRRWRELAAITAGTALGLLAFFAYVDVVLQPQADPKPVATTPSERETPAPADRVPDASGDRAAPTVSTSPSPATETGQPADEVTMFTGGYGEGPLDALLSTPVSTWLYRSISALASPNRGVLVQSPWLLLAIAGAWKMRRSAPVWARGLALGGIVYLAVQMRVNVFTGGARFVVYRLPLEALTVAAPVLLIGYREWIAQSPLRLRRFWALVGLSVGIQVFALVGRSAPPPPNWAFRQDDWTLGEYARSISIMPAEVAVSLALLAIILVTVGWRHGHEMKLNKS